MSFFGAIVRARFKLMSRRSAARLIESEAARYFEIVDKLGPENCVKSFRVPSMLGVDDDMRDWSVVKILGHNAIVNRQITVALIHSAQGEIYETDFNMKTDVMPADDVGGEQVEEFRNSVQAHLKAASGFTKLRGTLRRVHAIFGPLDAHGWNCVFGVHLQLHRKQAEAIAAQV